MPGQASSPRSNRRSHGAFIVLGLLASLSACGVPPAEEPIRHVLLVTLDTTRADRLGCYGGPAETPALSALAAEGVRFLDCTSAAATTLASHASIMTGTYPHRHGAARNGFVLDQGNLTLAESLAARDFWCAASLGSAALVGDSGIDQGFHRFDDAFDMAVTPGAEDQDQRRAASVTDSVLAHVDEVLGKSGGDAARLFLFAHYFDPHAPYGAPGSTGLPGRGGTAPAGGFQAIETAVRDHQTAVLGEAPGQTGVITGGLPPQLASASSSEPGPLDLVLAGLYDEELRYTDGEIGRLLLGLQQRGLLEHTLVVVTADHGETFWEHGNFWNHGLWVSQTDVHVPLLMRFPGGRAQGTTVQTEVSGVDIGPTILDALGFATGDGAGDPASGRSLMGAVDGLEFASRPVFTEATQPGGRVEGGAEPWLGARKPRAVRIGQWKLIESPYNGVRSLFHLGQDPGERRNLLAQSGPPPPGAKEALEEATAALRAWTESAQPFPSRFDRSQAKGLAGLGYAEALEDTESSGR